MSLKTLSWMPVDDIASVVVDLALSSERLRLVYHVENPVRQSRSDALRIIGAELGVQTLIPLEKWLSRVSDNEGRGNELSPASKLVDFFRQTLRACPQGR